jgi:acyl-CoA reductase-like NAD-dependent aldehyde dehydrogenase
VILVNPSTEDALGEVPDAGPDEVDAAVARSVAAYRAWRAVAPADRGRLLRRFAEAVDGDREHLAALEVANSGHTIGNARGEAAMVRDVLHYYAAAPERLSGRQIPVAGGWDVTFKEPLGPVAVIAPWNFPMTVASWGFAPALAAGNTVLLKPAELTPLTALRLESLALSAGLPDGVLQVVTGLGAVAGQRLVEHPDVRKVVFTGSTATGKRVMAAAAGTVKRVTLELGGKSANVVFADADLEKAATTAPMAVFDNAGQDCCARSRILVQSTVYDRFLELLEPAVHAVRVGDPAAPDTDMGPLISAAHRSRVASFVPAGAAIRGTVPAGPGFWFPPTVLAPVDPAAPVATEEVFGPVVAVIPFDDEADAVALSNASAYGLSGSLWTRDVGRALRVARALEVGALSVNSHSSVRYGTPFGGVKQSGLGGELGPDALDGFTDVKNVFLSTEG